MNYKIEQAVPGGKLNGYNNRCCACHKLLKQSYRFNLGPRGLPECNIFSSIAYLCAECKTIFKSHHKDSWLKVTYACSICGTPTYIRNPLKNVYCSTECTRKGVAHQRATLKRVANTQLSLF